MSQQSATCRDRFEIRSLRQIAPTMHRMYGKRKAATIGAFQGTVVELGPGIGANLRYYAPGTRVIAIEPNPAMHDELHATAAACNVDLEIRTVHGERIDLDDASADAVVGTLVLCTVADPAQVISEVQRVLVPGGTYFFLEHIAAPDATATRIVQALVKRPQRWLLNGCEVDRHTGELLQSSGFATIEIDTIDTGWRGGYLRHQIIGTATTADR